MIERAPQSLSIEEYFAQAESRLDLGALAVEQFYRMIVAGERIHDSHQLMAYISTVGSHDVGVKFVDEDVQMGAAYYGRMRDGFWYPNFQKLHPLSRPYRHVFVRAGYFLPLESVADEAATYLHKDT